MIYQILDIDSRRVIFSRPNKESLQNAEDAQLSIVNEYEERVQERVLLFFVLHEFPFSIGWKKDQIAIENFESIRIEERHCKNESMFTMRVSSIFKFENSNWSFRGEKK